MKEKYKFDCIKKLEYAKKKTINKVKVFEMHITRINTAYICKKFLQIYNNF